MDEVKETPTAEDIEKAKQELHEARVEDEKPKRQPVAQLTVIAYNDYSVDVSSNVSNVWDIRAILATALKSSCDIVINLNEVK